MMTINKAAEENGNSIKVNYGKIISPRKPLGLYLHIPFCIRKCNYCDFLSFEAGYDRQNAYVGALRKEIELCSDKYRNEYYVDSIFVGGGTPSLLDTSLLRELAEALKKGFVLSKDAEITIECNPKTLNQEKLEAYLDMGINRLSIGVQSFDNELLTRLGRAHSAEDFYNNYSLARSCGFSNINIDLMFSIPGQTLKDWKETLRRATDLTPEHLSFYSLQIEEGTPFFQMKKEGTLVETDGQEDRDMYHYAQAMLKAKDYHQYEISNAAKKGYESRHNLKYWSMDDYLGMGLGAHSFMSGVRFSNTTDLETYIRSGGSSVVWSRNNSREDSISEYLFTGLRRIAGVDLNNFQKVFGEPVKNVFSQNWVQIEHYIEDGYLIYDENQLRFTEKGIDISNTILTEFIF